MSEETLESSGESTETTAVTSESLEADFVKRVFGSEDAVITSREGNSVLVCDGYGVLFVEYVTEDEIKHPLSAYMWSVSDKWYSVDPDGNKIFLKPGLISSTKIRNG